MMENDCASPNNTNHKCQGNAHHQSNDSFTSVDTHDYAELDPAYEIPLEECQKFREVLERRCSNQGNSPQKQLYKIDSQSSIEREILVLNREMESIQIECQEIVDTHMRDKVKSQTDSVKNETPIRSPRMVPRMGTRLEYLKNCGHMPMDVKEVIMARQEALRKAQTEKDASNSSAYNTGDSCRSTPLTLELNATFEENGNGHRGSMLCLAPNTTNQKTQILPPSDVCSDSEKSTQTIGRSSSRSKDSRKDDVRDNNFPDNLKPQQLKAGTELYDKYANVMYTNQANLAHTIQLQQQMYQQRMLMMKARFQNATTEKCGDSSKTNEAQKENGGVNSEQSQDMEWVVKRRADGSRYITRRPIRKKLLKERAKKIADERCGMTTDDDAMSEMKLGRYWSKEDRKLHIEKARDHRKRKEQLLKQKLEPPKESAENVERKKEPNIVELSHKKMMKHKSKKVLDDFTTVQEMLAHGSKGNETKTYNPLLSVTTV